MSKEIAIKKTKQVGDHINNTKVKLNLRPVVDFMTDDFEFNDGAGHIHQGKKKATGGKPFCNSVNLKGFIAYDQTVTDSRCTGKGIYEVDVDAKLEAKNSKGVVKVSEWPITFTWIVNNGKWYLRSVEYLEKMTWKKKNPAKQDAPVRAFATQEAATSIGNTIEQSSSDSTNQKVKRSIRDKIDALSKRNRQK